LSNNENLPPTIGVPTIGVFDSGFGGLTVLRALLTRLPRASFAFLGDTARLPYGSKSRRTIARYAVESAQFLVREQGAEFLVIACNTASALALDAIQDAVPVPVLGVIEPGATAARAASLTGDVLVIATDATVQSHAYAAACKAQGLRAFEKACPLLVPLVEEGWGDPSSVFSAGSETAAAQAASAPPQVASDSPQVAVTAEVIRIYLDELIADAAAAGLKPDALVLGCTHYPLLRPLIEKAVPEGMKVIDSAEAAAEAAARLFNGRVNGCPTLSVSAQANTDRVGEDSDIASHASIRCFATDSVEKFERLGSRFLGRAVGKVELVDLGG
jgi:glutamate racemase